jgi:hypothetical protein
MALATVETPSFAARSKQMSNSLVPAKAGMAEGAAQGDGADCAKGEWLEVRKQDSSLRFRRKRTRVVS